MNKNALSTIKEHQAPSSNLPIAYIITASTEVIENEPVLFISLWGQKNIKNRADFKIFLYEGGYISQGLKQYKNKEIAGYYEWCTARMEYLVGMYWGSGTKVLCYRLKDRQVIGKFFNTKVEHGQEYNIINKFQQRIMIDKLEAKHKKITDKIDNVMSNVETLPADFDRWVHNGPFGFSRYIYYKRQGKKINAFCTECKKEFVIEETKITLKNIKHNNSGKCPLCNKKIVYKAKGKTTQLSDRTGFAIMQKYEDGFITRYFAGVKSYEDHYKNPSVYYHETIREICTIQNNKLNIKKYEYATFLQTGKVRWCDDTGKRTIPKAYLYTRNLQSLINDTRWKYSCMYDYAKEVKYLYPSTFLEEYIKHPQIEYLIKFKLYEFVDDKLSRSYPDWSDINFNGKGIKGIFGIDKQAFQQMQRLNLGETGLELIKEFDNLGKAITDIQVKWILKNISSYMFNRLYKILEYTTIHQIIKYITKQSNGKYEPDSVVGDWNDYIDQCKTLKYDLNSSFILFPKNLLEKHEECSMMCDTEKLKKYDSKVKNAFDKVNDLYSYADSNFIVRPVESVSEIVAEGHKQRHCVASGGYVEKIANGKIEIMLVRKINEPNNPFYTLELDLKNLNVMQCRGFRNCGMTPEVEDFILKWKSSSLTKKDKEKIKLPA